MAKADDFISKVFEEFGKLHQEIAELKSKPVEKKEEIPVETKKKEPSFFESLFGFGED